MISIIALIFLCIFLLKLFKYRSYKVWYMKQELLDMCIEYDNRNYVDFLCSTESSYFWAYSRLPSSRFITYSLLPIRLDYWLQKDTIDRLSF